MTLKKVRTGMLSSCKKVELTHFLFSRSKFYMIISLMPLEKTILTVKIVYKHSFINLLGYEHFASLGTF